MQRDILQGNHVLSEHISKPPNPMSIVGIPGCKTGDLTGLLTAKMERSSINLVGTRSLRVSIIEYIGSNVLKTIKN
jgi:hypothetical protein